MLTDRDIVVRVVAERRDPERQQVKDVMTSQVDDCYEDQDSEEAAQVMQDRQVRRVPIINGTSNWSVLSRSVILP